MGDLRLVDLIGLYRVAALLDEAARVVRSIGRSALIPGGGAASGGSAASLFGIAGALEAAAGDLRRRRIEDVPAGSSCRAPFAQIDPRPVSLGGFDGASERWSFGTLHDDGDWLRDSLVRGEWGGQAAVRRTDISGRLGTFSASALVAEAQAEAWIGFDDWAVELGGEAEVGLHLAQVEYSLNTQYFDLESEAFVGGEASVAGDLDLDFFDGDAGFEGGLSAFVGMAAAAEVGVGPDAARVIAGGEVGIGFGVDVDAALGYVDGIMNFDFGASAFLGLGGGFDMSLDIDLGTIGRTTVDLIEGATGWITSLWP